MAQQISQISGVAQVIIGGQQKPAIRVQIDPAKLVAKGLSLEDVRNQIAITFDSPRQYRRHHRAYTIYANDQLLDSRTGTTSSSPIATVALYSSRYRPGRHGSEDAAGRLGQREAACSW
jgi:multidrug efflux pump subunit AcrB